jgi:ABC-type uncharacterized transport system substrate-binding protein
MKALEMSGRPSRCGGVGAPAVVVSMIAVLSFALPLSPRITWAQHTAHVHRIGIVSSGGAEQEHIFQATLRQHLRERGWVESQNLVVEWRYAEAQYDKARDLINELIGHKPDLLMTRGEPITKAAKRASGAIPIVMWGVTDPAGIGVVASLARPRGNVTGLSDDPSPEIMGKRLQLLKEIAPAVTRVAILTRVPLLTWYPA